jgi:hypothetical protein
VRITKTPIERIFTEEADREPTSSERRVLLKKPKKKTFGDATKSKKTTSRLT